MIEFDSGFKIVGGLSDSIDELMIQKEPMLFAANRNFALAWGGAITRGALLALPADWNNSSLVIDSRVHMLTDGWYPAIPGYHIDDVPRTRSDRQPNYKNPEYKAEHIAVVCGSPPDVSRTAFIKGIVKLPDVPLGQKVYQQWNKDIKEQVKNASVEEIRVPNNALVQFGFGDFHRAVPAQLPEGRSFGWRLFLRISRNTKREVWNQIRTQTQVYLTDVEGGW